MRSMHCKYSFVYACQKFFAPLVGKPNLCGQLLFTAHGLALNWFESKKFENTAAALIIEALGLHEAKPLPEGFFLRLVFDCFTIWVIFNFCKKETKKYRIPEFFPANYA